MAERLEDFALQLHPADDVAVVRKPIRAGLSLMNGQGPFEARQDIPQGHKIAVHPIAAGAAVRKYGQIIGFASAAIAAGDHVHAHNLGVKDFGRDYEFSTDLKQFAPVTEARTFGGYLRPDGRVGTRNYVAVISSVNCSASVSNYVRDRFRTPEFRRDYPNIDGVIAFTHKSGCNVQPGDPFHTLRRVHVGLARHPNIAGYVMMGLGCEGNQVEFLRKDFGLDQVKIGQPGPSFMTIQQTGGVMKTVERAVEAVRRILPAAEQARRTPQPVSKLILAENCGGSDGYSGITANPALGIASDELVRHGGTSVLAETPEIYGAEHLLTRRAVAKGGQAPLVAVYKYAEEIKAQGFCFMDTPGFDPVSMTGLVCGGATVGVFTTGRGSVYGCKPSPCIKVSTNTAIYEHMMDDMDVNAGTVIDGTETLEQVGRRIFEKIVSVVGVEMTKREITQLGDEEFGTWILGPSLHEQ